MTFIKILCS